MECSGSISFAHEARYDDPSRAGAVKRASAITVSRSIERSAPKLPWPEVRRSARHPAGSAAAGEDPWFPLLGQGDLAKPRGPVARVAQRLHATPAQVALPRDAPHPRHVERQAPRGERRGGAARARRSGLPRPRSWLTDRRIKLERTRANVMASAAPPGPCATPCRPIYRSSAFRGCSLVPPDGPRRGRPCAPAA